MEDINRRCAMALGLTAAAATPLVGLAGPAAAAMYGPDVGKEVMPGTREIDLGDYPVKMGPYTKATVRDYVGARRALAGER